MMMKTHIILSKSIYENLDEDNKFLLDENNFIYGNVKPDLISKYKLEKHYLDESYDMIKEKIQFMINLSLSDLEKMYSVKSFSQEIGVICHFLADFFCVAHSERWEFKHSMKIHIIYEKNLTKVAKDFDLKNERVETYDDFDVMFEKLYSEYKSNGNFETNDLVYSSVICNTVTNYILDNILVNTSNPIAI